MKKIFRLLCLALLPFSFLDANHLFGREERKVYPVVIFGSGIGALTSSLYLARAGLQPIVIEGKNPGGLLTQSHSVQNWPGEMDIEGAALIDRVRAQAKANGVEFRSEEVIGVDFSKRPFTIQTRRFDSTGKLSQKSQIQAETCIIAMGTQPNFLGVPGETGPNGYWGRGVTNCAICDGSLYRDRAVGVVGGGDAAVLEALYLSNIAKKVYVFVRKDALRAIEEKRVETLLAKPNVKIVYETTVEEIKGTQENMTHVILKSGSNAPYELPLDGLFLAIGSTPNTAIFKDVLNLDAKGYIQLQKDQETAIRGVYAIGDIVDPVYKQAISASGDGAKAAMQVQSYLSDRANHLVKSSLLPQKNESQATPVYEVVEIVSLEQFNRELKTNDVPVLVDFYATWCGPCKQISPMLESSANQLGGKVKFLKVNVDKMLALSRTYKIQAMPTVLLFNPSGDLIERKVGTEQISDLLNRLQSRTE